MATAAQIEAVERLVRESVATVDRMAPGALRAILPALRDAREEMRRDLSDWLANAPDGADRFTAYHRTQALRSMEATFERIGELHPAMANALGIAREATGPLSVQNLSTEIHRLSAIFGDGPAVLPSIDSAAVIAEGNKLLWRRHETSAKRYAGAVGDDMRHLLAVGLAKGETFEQLVTRLRRVGNTTRARGMSSGDAAADIADGLFQRHKHWADRLVRTEAMNAYNVQHDIAIEHVNANRDEDDEPYMRRWDASADVVTCDRCKELDRTLATIEGSFKFGYKAPPAHPYCRCVVLAWLARWGHFKGETKARDHAGADVEPREPTPKPKPVKAKPPKDLRGEETPALRNELGWTYDRPRTANGTTGRMLKRGDKRRTDVVQSDIGAPAPAPAPKPAKAPKIKPAPIAPPPPLAAEPEAVVWEHKKNPKRVAAAKKAAEASAERRREIHSAIATNLPAELRSTWDKEGHKFMVEQGHRIKGEKDRINAASRMSQAFAETYGSGSETAHGNEGDRFHRRAEIEAKHAESWADEQEHKYYEAARAAAHRAGEIDEHGETTATGHAYAEKTWSVAKAIEDDDCPF